MKIEEWKAEKITPYARNPRNNKDAISKVKSSIKEFGWQQPIVVDKDGIIIVGHTRYQAGLELGLKVMPVHVADNLTPEQVKAYRIVDNKSSEFATWDDDLLALELSDLSEFCLEGYEDLFNGDNLISAEELNNDDDFIEPEVIQTDIKYGDIIQIGPHRLMCGDSTELADVERLMDGEKADMVFTDPPYGYSYQSNYQDTHEMLKNDDKILDFLPICFDELKNDTPFYICGSWQTIGEWIGKIKEGGLNLKNIIVWKKNNWSMGDLKGAYAGQYEVIFFAHKGRCLLSGGRERDVWEFDREPPSLHPTMKPIPLISRAINNHDAGNILDPFLGSGSTMVACHQLKRVCYGMELEPKYCQVIVDRMKHLDPSIEIKKV